MGRYSIDEFVETTGQRDLGEGMFELERDRLLEINLDGSVWTKKGSMVAYPGDVKFTREGVLEHGLGKLVKKAVTGEGMSLTKVEGTGKVYLADGVRRYPHSIRTTSLSTLTATTCSHLRIRSSGTSRCSERLPELWQAGAST